MTDGWYPYDLDKGLMPDAIQDETIATLEKAVPSIDAVSELKKAGLWKDVWVVDPIRMAPWGREERPYIFAQSTRVSLTAPLDEGVKIYYTLDGTKPGLNSKLYSSPITVTKTTTIRATAFRGNKQACLESAGYYVPLPPALPAPDVHISDLKGLRETSGGYNTAANERYRIPRTRLPAKDQSKNSTPLMLRQNQYGKGVGVEAPSMLMYEVKPEYDRFVAECGVDEYLLWDEIGAARALFPKLKFKVFIDGKLVAESPWQRFAQQPWRFDVKIPFLSRAINLVVVPSEDSRYSFADWVNAGFVIKK
jgi:hypothetical protein